MNMSNSFVGQINLFSGPLNPQFWKPCDGSSLNTIDYATLSTILDQKFGGDKDTVVLPTIADLNNTRYLICTESPEERYETPKGTTGEIVLFVKGATPDGWIACDGTFLNKNNYAELYALIGGSFGHNESSFALPSIPPPIDDTVYAICHSGASPWSGGGENDFSLDGTVGAVQLFAANMGFNSQTWLICDGKSVGINENTQLYAVMGNKYGGDSAHFNVPTIPGPAMHIDYIICNQGIYPSE